MLILELAVHIGGMTVLDVQIMAIGKWLDYIKKSGEYR